LHRTIGGLIRLTRFREYLFFVTVTTLLGVSAAGGKFGWPLVAVLLGNMLAVGFAFMINDVEDAPDDALNPRKLKRNPVSARDVTPRAAWIASLVVAALAFLVYLPLGAVPLALGTLCLGLGFVYSWRRLRLKNIAFLDFLSHVMMLAGLQYLCAYFTFTGSFNDKWLVPFIFVVAISLYGELFNEMRDLEGDLKAGLRHTAAVLGGRFTYWAMMTIFAIGVGAGVITFFWVGVVESWTLVVMACAAVIFIIPPLLKLRRSHNSIETQEPLQKPLEMAGALGLLAQFMVPWVARIFGGG